MDPEIALREFGLSDNEIKVYLANLSLGSSTANEIGQKAGILRTTSYEILKSLVERGIVSHITKDKKRYFEAANPKKFIQILDEKKEKMKESLESLQKLKESTTQKPDVEVYEGKEGLKTILEDLIKNADKEYKVIGNNQKFREILKEYYTEQFIIKRLKSNIKCEFIAEPGKSTKELIEQDKKVKRKTKIMEGLENSKAELFIYKDKIAIFTLIKEQPIGILIKEKNISELFKVLFGEIWDSN